METLLIGNTGYVTREFIRNTFPDDSVVVIGNSKLKTDKKFHITSYPVSMEDEHAEKIVKGRSFEKIVYFSNYLTMHHGQQGEMERIRKIFHTYGTSKDAEIIYLTSLEGNYAETSGKTMLVRDAENLCLYYAETLKREVKIIRIPFLYSAFYEEDYIYKMIKDMNETNHIWLLELAEHHAYFLNPEDLSELLYRVFDLWDKKTEILNVPDRMNITFGDLVNCMKEINSHLQVHYAGKAENHTVFPVDKSLREKYGWTQKYSLLQEFPELYEQFQQKNQLSFGKETSVFRWLKSHEKIVKGTELFGGFIFMELLNRISGNSVQFRMIDFRLLFIMIISSIYGMNMGIAASVLAGISLAWAYWSEGTNWMTLFYEPMNWIPFIAYLSVAVISGYVRLKSRDKVKLVQRENELLQEKFLTLRTMYLEIVENQKKYKKQIIGTRDSFGKIFEITKMLDETEPQEILVKAVHALEEILENQTIAIYSLGKEQKYGDLAVCSKNVKEIIPEKISLKKYEEVLASVEKGEVWTNKELLENYPMYLTCIKQTEKRSLLVMVCSTSYEQKGLYYINLIKMVCGLIESSVSRAMKYQQFYENEVKK